MALTTRILHIIAAHNLDINSLKGEVNIPRLVLGATLHQGGPVRPKQLSAVRNISICA